MNEHLETPTVELVRRAQAGESVAREELFTRYRGRVLAIARTRLGAKLRGMLESTDILQEALTEAAGGLERFEMRDESSLIRWLALLVEHRITAKAAYHAAARRAAAVVPLEPPSVDGASDEIPFPSETPTPSVELVRREENDAVQAALARLPEHLRELVLLRDYAGSSWEEVAKAVGAPSPNAARMMHARALARLGEALRGMGS